MLYNIIVNHRNVKIEKKLMKSASICIKVFIFAKIILFRKRKLITSLYSMSN